MKRTLAQNVPLPLDENSLIQNYQSFIRGVVYHYIGKYGTFVANRIAEDAYSEACIAFLRECRKEKVGADGPTPLQLSRIERSMEYAIRRGIWKMFNTKNPFSSKLTQVSTFTDESERNVPVEENESVVDHSVYVNEEFSLDMERLLGKDFSVALMLMQGFSCVDIAEQLKCSIKTVYYRVKIIQKKLAPYYQQISA